VSAISVRNLRKSYGGREALRGISFEIAAGEVFSLLGPNGAGKTTTIEILEGYRTRDEGDVEVLGLDPGRAGSPFRERIICVGGLSFCIRGRVSNRSRLVLFTRIAPGISGTSSMALILP
jgi:ABC-type multidrug transport system ATPase subunit